MSQTGTGKVLATFNIDGEMWNAFKRKAKVQGLSAAAALTKYVKAYIDSASDPLEYSSSSTAADKVSLDRHLERRLDQYLKKGETDYLDSYLDNYLVDNLEGYLQSYLSRYLARYLEELQGIQPEAQVTAALSLGGELRRQALVPNPQEGDRDDIPLPAASNLTEEQASVSKVFSVGEKVKIAELINAGIVERRQMVKVNKGQKITGIDGSIWHCEGEAIGLRGRPKLFRRIG